MFKAKRAKTENTAAIPASIPRPAQTVINQAPSEAGRIFALAIVYGAGGIIGWYFLLYILDEMGVRNPVGAFGWFLSGGAGLLVLSIALDRTITKWYKMKREFDLQLEEIRAETARSLALTAAQPRPGESRLTEEDSKFAALLRVVMSEAYQHIYRDRDIVQQYNHNEQKPWSRRANTGRSIPGIEGTVTEQMASRVAAWLMEQGVIDKKGVIDISDRGYPSFAHFERLLEEKFYTPIQVQKALSPTLRREVSFIENS